MGITINLSIVRGPSFIKTLKSMSEVVLDLPDIKNSLIFCLKIKEKGELHAYAFFYPILNKFLF